MSTVVTGERLAMQREFAIPAFRGVVDGCVPDAANFAGLKDGASYTGLIQRPVVESLNFESWGPKAS